MTLLLAFFAISIYAQNVTVKGSVKDQLGEPIVGGTVMVKGANKGTITDIDGKYSIECAPNATLSFSYIGYVTSEENVNNRTTINVQLKEESTSLKEVVVTALGMKRDQKALGYAVTELKGDELDGNLINPVLALQGKVAGVEINSSDGGMFGASKILIRGASTLNKNNQPIYVVDGVILDNGVVENDADWASGAQNYGNELKNLNPDDFESVSVLKGAAATALYGSRGLNGAIVITTKSGKGKKGLGIEFSQTFGFDKVTSQPDLQNEYAESFFYCSSPNSPFNVNDLYWTNEQGYASYKVLSSYGEMGTAFGPSFEYIRQHAKDGKIEMYDGQLYDAQPYKNNFKDAYDTGFNTNTNVAISGGNDRTSFYTSLSYRYNNGTLPNNDFRRFSFLAKASHKLTNNVEIEASMTYATSKPRNAQPNIGENFVNGTWDRMYDAKYYRDKYKGAHGGIAQTQYGDEWGFVIGRGTWWSIWENEYYQKETVFRPSLKLTWQLTPWLKWITEGNYNYYFVQGEGKYPGSGYYNQGGSYSTSQSRKEQKNLNTNLMVDKQINEDWRVNGFLRYEYFNAYRAGISASTKGDLIVPNQYFLANGVDGYEASSAISGTKTIHSIAAQIGASWKDQVFLDVTGRNDWSSSLVYADGHGNYSYFYPSVSASWLITNTFRETLPTWLSFWKIRGSYAQVGNDCDAYYINTAYGLESYTNNFGKSYSTTLPETTYSKDLKPERKKSWEFGTDIRFLNNRIGIDFTYYKENTTNQIMQVAIPEESGYKKALINAGNIQNSGIELALNTTPIATKDWQWDLNFTYTKNSSKIVELSDLCADYITLAGDPAYGNFRIGAVAKVGGTYGMLMSDSQAKRDEESGLPVLSMAYYNAGYHTPYIPRAGKVEEVGNSVPDFLGSINTSLRYKNWTLSASFDARFGGKVASYNSRYGTAYGYTKTSLAGRGTNNGGITYKSGFDGVTYDDGIIPEGIVTKGAQILQPDGTMYTVGTGQYSSGETYEELVKGGHAEYVHAGGWHYFTNSWGQGVLNDNWFVTLNYIAFRDLSLSYAFDSKIANVIGCRRLALSAQAHNLGYLLNSMPNHENPEAIAGTTTAEFRQRQFSGITTSFTFTIKATF